MRYPTSNLADLRAPKAQFRVVAVDVSEASGTYLLGDYATMDAANEVARGRASVGSPVFIYNDSGELLLRLGSWH